MPSFNSSTSSKKNAESRRRCLQSIRITRSQSHRSRRGHPSFCGRPLQRLPTAFYAEVSRRMPTRNGTSSAAIQRTILSRDGVNNLIEQHPPLWTREERDRLMRDVLLLHYVILTNWPNYDTHLEMPGESTVSSHEVEADRVVRFQILSLDYILLAFYQLSTVLPPVPQNVEHVRNDGEQTSRLNFVVSEIQTGGVDDGDEDRRLTNQHVNHLQAGQGHPFGHPTNPARRNLHGMINVCGNWIDNLRQTVDAVLQRLPQSARLFFRRVMQFHLPLTEVIGLYLIWMCATIEYQED